MGTPNNLTSQTTQTDQASQPERTALDVLRELVCSPSRPVREVDLHRFGLDIDMLEATFEQNFRPLLDYVSGYQELADEDPSPMRPNDQESWSVLLDRLNFNGHVQCLQVFSGSLSCVTSGPSSARRFSVKVYLTRQGHWLLWMVEERIVPSPSIIPDSELVRSFDTVRDLLAAFDEQLPSQDYAFHWRGDQLSKWIPLRIEARLRYLLVQTIEQREKRLTSMKEAETRAMRLVSSVSYSY